jgi:nicotinate-nucleotide adenylyltransferase
MAEVCRERCRLDEVWFVPAARPPHKTDRELADVKYREEMLDFALAGCPEFSVSRIELEREGTSYTYKTLQQLHDAAPERELFFLIGADSLHDLPGWREPQKILELARVVAVNRGKTPPPDLTEIEDKLGPEAVDRIQLVTMPGIDLSSTDVRHRVRSGHSIRFLVPKAVEAYIREHKLYLPSE